MNKRQQKKRNKNLKVLPGGRQEERKDIIRLESDERLKRFLNRALGRAKKYDGPKDLSNTKEANILYLINYIK